MEIISHFWKSVTMELISVGRKSFGKNFWRIKFSWKKFLNFIIFLEKTSIGNKNFGKTFLWKKFLKLANPWTNLPLEKSSFGRMYFGKNFLKNNFFGKNYLGNFYFGKNPLDIFTGCRHCQHRPGDTTPGWALTPGSWWPRLKWQSVCHIISAEYIPCSLQFHPCKEFWIGTNKSKWIH